MIIIVISPDRTEESILVEKDEILIGRSQECDVKISSEVLSRKHLQVSKKGNEIYIRDLTLANWVSYNDEKLPKKTDVLYYDFAPLLLPGNIIVKIQDESEEEVQQEVIEQIISDAKVLEKKSIQETRREKLKKLKEEKEAEKKNKAMMILSVLALVAFLGFYFKDEIFIEETYTAPKIIPKYKRSGEKVVSNTPANTQRVNSSQNRQVNKKTVTMADSQRELESAPLNIRYENYRTDQNVCVGSVINILCNTIFLRRDLKEGILERGEKLVVLKDLDIRLRNMFFDNVSKVEKRKLSDEVLFAVAGQEILRPSLLKRVKDLGITKIEVILFHKNKLIKAYQIETSVYNRFENKDYFYSFEKAILKNLNFTKFTQEFSSVLIKVEN